MAGSLGEGGGAGEGSGTGGLREGGGAGSLGDWWPKGRG